MAKEYVTLLRVKRKRDDTLQQALGETCTPDLRDRDRAFDRIEV